MKITYFEVKQDYKLRKNFKSLSYDFKYLTSH